MKQAEEKKIFFNSESFSGAQLYPNRFDQDLLARLRLGFVTSKYLIDNGGSKILENLDFKKEFDPFNEECTL